MKVTVTLEGDEAIEYYNYLKARERDQNFHLPTPNPNLPDPGAQPQAAHTDKEVVAALDKLEARAEERKSSKRGRPLASSQPVAQLPGLLRERDPLTIARAFGAKCGGTPALLAKLKAAGVARVTDLKGEKLAAFLDDLEAAVVVS
jgi:hypothetical protein